MATLSSAESLALRTIVRGDDQVSDIRPWRRKVTAGATEILESASDLRRMTGHLLNAGRDDDAEYVAQFLLSNHRGDFLALEVAGDVARQRDDIPAALRRYQRAAALMGAPRVALLGVVRVLAKSGDALEDLGLSRPALEMYYRCAALLTSQMHSADDPWEWYEPWRGPAPMELLGELRARTERLEASLAVATPAAFAGQGALHPGTADISLRGSADAVPRV